MKTIFINEDKLNALVGKTEAEKPTFFRFFTELKKFIGGLLNDPINARPSTELEKYGLDNDKLRITLQNNHIVVKKETIKEPYDETTGKKVSRYYLTYKVPRKDFKKKIRRMYQKMFEK